jgi:pimeloyl-ACP methyl ester carboxylesterase
MSLSTQEATEVRPFTIEVPEAELVELKRRITQTRWPERETGAAYPNLIYFNEADTGGHFAAWEQPQLFAEGMRAGFTSLR